MNGSNTNAQEYSKQLIEVYHGVRAGRIKEIPTISKEAREKLLSKMPEDQKALFGKVDVKSVNAFISLAKKTKDEEEFIAFINDPESVAVKLTKAEMDALSGGVNWGRLILGSASMVAVIGSIGLSAGGCAAGLAIHGALYP